MALFLSIYALRTMYQQLCRNCDERLGLNAVYGMQLKSSVKYAGSPIDTLITFGSHFTNKGKINFRKCVPAILTPPVDIYQL